MDKCCAVESSMAILSTTASGSAASGCGVELMALGVIGMYFDGVVSMVGVVDGTTGAALLLVSVGGDDDDDNDDDDNAIVLSNAGIGIAEGVTVATGSTMGVDDDAMVTVVTIASVVGICASVDGSSSTIGVVGSVDDGSASALVVAIVVGGTVIGSEAIMGNAFGAITIGAGNNTCTIAVGDSSIAFGNFSAGMIGIGIAGTLTINDSCGTMQWDSPIKWVSCASIRPIKWDTSSLHRIGFSINGEVEDVRIGSKIDEQRRSVTF